MINIFTMTKGKNLHVTLTLFLGRKLFDFIYLSNWFNILLLQRAQIYNVYYSDTDVCLFKTALPGHIIPG